jgi:glycosyltransferase involved in cell wall biosynthesis
MRVCMLLQKSVEHDSRVRREARALSEAGHRVEVVHTPPSLPGPALAEEPFALTTATIPRLRRLPLSVHRLAEAFNLVRLVRRGRPDAVHAHDVAMLVPAYIAARLARARLVYDSHELATGVPYRSRPWALLVVAIEHLIVPRCDAVITVSGGISDRLRERYSLASSPTVVRNLCDLPPPGAAAAPDLRRELGIGEAPLILHQGAVSCGRGCEILIRAMSGLDGAHLLFLGAEGPYAERLRALAASLGLSERVHFHPPVALASLLSYTAQADLGISLLEDTCENHRLTLPNKTFEYVAAGRPVMVSNLPALQRLVESYGIGWAVDPRDLCQVEVGLRAGLGADGVTRTRVKRAAEKLSWRREVRGLIDLYTGLDAEFPPPKDDRRVTAGHAPAYGAKISYKD